MAQDPSTIVRSSTMLWSDQVALVEAQTVLDYALPGQDGIASLVDKQQPWVYQFSNGRKFVDKTNPYS